MPKFECRCSFLFNLSKSPGKDEYALVPEVVVADLLDMDGVSSLELSTALDPVSRQVLLCPRCRRLWLQTDPDVNSFIEYVLASDSG